MAFGDVVQSNSGAGTTASVTPTLPGATTNGNLLLLSIAADDYNGSPPAFWTQPTGGEQQTFHGGYLWYRFCGAGDTIAAYTIGSAVRSAWVLVEIEGPFDTFDLSNGTFSQSSGSNIATPSLTPTAGDRLLIAGIQFQHANLDQTALTGFTNSFVENRQTLSNGANPRFAIAQLRRLVTANGSTAYSTAADGSTAQSRSAIIAAFKKGASGGGAVTGTLAVTLAPATLAATGKALAKGTLTATLADATLAGVGKALAQGTLTATLAPATLVATGSVGAVPTSTGTLAVTLAPATLLATGIVGTVPTSIGTLAVTLAPATLAAAGTVANRVFTGTLNATLADATLAAIGKVAVRGSLTATLAPATLAAIGTVAWPTITGTLAVTLDPATLVAFGTQRPQTEAPSSVCLDGLWNVRVKLTGTYRLREVLPCLPISRCTRVTQKFLTLSSRTPTASPLT